MIESIAAGSTYGVSLLASISHDYLKRKYQDYKISTTIERVANEVAESYDMRIDGHNPLLLAIRSDQIDDLCEQGQDRILIEDISRSVANILETEFDTNPQAVGVDTQQVAEEYITELETELILHDDIRSKILLRYLHSLDAKQSESEEYLKKLEQQSERFDRQLDQLTTGVSTFQESVGHFDSNIEKLNLEVDRLSELTNQIEKYSNERGVDQDKLKELNQRITDADELSEKQIDQAITDMDFEENIHSELIEIFKSVYSSELTKPSENSTSKPVSTHTIDTLRPRRGVLVKVSISYPYALHIDCINHNDIPIVVMIDVEANSKILNGKNKYNFTSMVARRTTEPSSDTRSIDLNAEHNPITGYDIKISTWVNLIARTVSPDDKITID